MAFLVDIPLCTTEGVPDFNRGFVEKSSHYDVEEEAVLDGVDAGARATEVAGRSLVVLTRDDLDRARRVKRSECARCSHDSRCEGVWAGYVSRMGWDELVPVE